MNDTYYSICRIRKICTGLAFTLLVAIGVVVFVVPFFWLVTGSFKTALEILFFGKDPIEYWWPREFYLENFKKVIDILNMGRLYLNSFIVTVSSIVGVLVTSLLGGYGFAKFRFPGQKLMFLLLLGTMMIPFQLKMVPLYLMVYRLGLLNTYAGLIVPTAVSAFGIFLMRQFMYGIPNELIDAARIDGCSEMGIFWRIVVPNCRAPVAALAILGFTGNWNSFLWPLLVVNRQELMTVTLGIGNLAISYGGGGGQIDMNTPVLIAGTVLAVLPVVIFYLIFQKRFTQGIAISGIKG